MDMIDYVCRVGPLGRYLRLENNLDVESAAELFGRHWVQDRYDLADDFEKGGDAKLAGDLREMVNRVRALAAHPDLVLENMSPKHLFQVAYKSEKHDDIPAEEMGELLMINQTNEDEIEEIVRLLCHPEISEVFIPAFIQGVAAAHREITGEALGGDE
ncbi:hypothetical protein V3589_14840 [Sinorhizobium fredii]|uniref:hypothetical protein n=1 Tax=Rhizobium fredii TaxID=380 RepID=UPI0030A44EB8